MWRVHAILFFLVWVCTAPGAEEVNPRKIITPRIAREIARLDQKDTRKANLKDGHVYCVFEVGLTYELYTITSGKEKDQVAALSNAITVTMPPGFIESYADGSFSHVRSFYLPRKDPNESPLLDGSLFTALADAVGNDQRKLHGSIMLQNYLKIADDGRAIDNISFPFAGDGTKSIILQERIGFHQTLLMTFGVVLIAFPILFAVAVSTFADGKSKDNRKFAFSKSLTKIYSQWVFLPSALGYYFWWYPSNGPKVLADHYFGVSFAKYEVLGHLIPITIGSLCALGSMRYIFDGQVQSKVIATNPGASLFGLNLRSLIIGFVGLFTFMVAGELLFIFFDDFGNSIASSGAIGSMGAMGFFLLLAERRTPDHPLEIFHFPIDKSAVREACVEVQKVLKLNFAGVHERLIPSGRNEFEIVSVVNTISVPHNAGEQFSAEGLRYGIARAAYLDSGKLRMTFPVSFYIIIILCTITLSGPIPLVVKSGFVILIGYLASKYYRGVLRSQMLKAEIAALRTYPDPVFSENYYKNAFPDEWEDRFATKNTLISVYLQARRKLSLDSSQN